MGSADARARLIDEDERDGGDETRACDRPRGPKWQAAVDVEVLEAAADLSAPALPRLPPGRSIGAWASGAAGRLVGRRICSAATKFAE